MFQGNKEDLYMILFFIPIKLKNTMFWQVAGDCANFPNDKATILHVNVDVNVNVNVKVWDNYFNNKNLHISIDKIKNATNNY